MAEGSDLKYSLADNNTQVRYIVDGNPSTCLRLVVVIHQLTLFSSRIYNLSMYQFYIYVSYVLY